MQKGQFYNIIVKFCKNDFLNDEHCSFLFLDSIYLVSKRQEDFLFCLNKEELMQVINIMYN